MTSDYCDIMPGSDDECKLDISFACTEDIATLVKLFVSC